MKKCLYPLANSLNNILFFNWLLNFNFDFRNIIVIDTKITYKHITFCNGKQLRSVFVFFFYICVLYVYRFEFYRKFDTVMVMIQVYKSYTPVTN